MNKARVAEAARGIIQVEHGVSKDASMSIFSLVTSVEKVLSSRKQRERLVGDAKTESNGTKERVVYAELCGTHAERRGKHSKE